MRRKPASSSEVGKMRSKLLMSAAGLLVAIAPVMGHHAFGGEFDPNRPVLLKGKVSKLEWVNPHAWIHMVVTCTGEASKPSDPVCVGKQKGHTEHTAPPRDHARLAHRRNRDRGRRVSEQGSHAARQRPRRHLS